jgi:hypothetical protein
LLAHITSTATGQVGVVNGVVDNPVINRRLVLPGLDTADDTFANLMGKAIIGDHLQAAIALQDIFALRCNVRWHIKMAVSSCDGCFDL